MKMIKVAITVMVLVGLGVLIQPVSSFAYSGAWEPTDGSVFTVQTEFGGAVDSLFIYDYGNPSNSLDISSGSGFGFTTIYFHEDAFGVWYADTTDGGTSLLLGADPLFGFYFSDGINIWDEYTLTDSGNGAFILYDPNTMMTVAVHDAVPTPIPSSILLLGAGLVGMIRFRMRRQKARV